MSEINLSYNITFSDLYTREGILKVDTAFLDFLRNANDDLYQKLVTARTNPKLFPSSIEESNFLMEVAEHLECFLIKLFHIEAENKQLQESQLSLAFPATERPALMQKRKKTDFGHLVDFEEVVEDGVTVKRACAECIENRQGFSLTDKGVNQEKAMAEASCCTYCYKRNNDSCSKGVKDKDGAFKKDEAGSVLIGCPLEEKASEMNCLKAQGKTLAALAMATIDNPLLAATGHRICNECVKACKFSGIVEGISIPEIETRTFKDVLNLPWGFEIYSLLTRWNPLNLRRPYPKENSGYKVLVVGMGPAGFNLSHHLLNEGHTVVGIDGLKIEPLGIDFAPIKNISEFFEDLDTRSPGGFGGVMEYGITVRWDKNNLKILRLLLERRDNFKVYGGTRFGSQISKESAFNELGFDHIALCMGAGSPNIVPMKNNLIRGVRMASDFLMTLQLSGAARKDSVANLQILLPVVVIGGGLTAIDCATESLAYYVRQVEKFAERYNTLVAKHSKEYAEREWSVEDRIIAEEFLSHAAELSKTENKLELLRKWGGVKILYRKSFEDCPAYRVNPEEVTKAFAEGIDFVDNVAPKEIVEDEFGAVNSLVCDYKGEIKTFPARTILIAAGTQPNIISAKEDPDNFILDGKYFRAIKAEDVCKVYDLRNVNEGKKEVSLSQKVFDEIIKSLQNGGVISFVANTVYGLGCDATNDEAVKKLYYLKHRDTQKPIALFFKDKEQAENYVQFNDTAHQFVDKFDGSDFTMILHQKPSSELSKFFNTKDDTIGFRIPNHYFSHELLEKFGKPLAVTSANIAGQSEAASIDDIVEIFGNNIDFVVEGSGKKSGVPSTVVDLSTGEIKVIRQGELDVFSEIAEKCGNKNSIKYNEIMPERSAKPHEVNVITDIDVQGRAVSFFGDMHPSFAGNVVRAMASAKRGYPSITEILERFIVK